MIIDQFVPSFVMNDAISNHVLQIRRTLREAGHESDIWYERVDHRLAGEARPFEEYDAAPGPDRAVIYHASTDSPMAAWLADAARSGLRLIVDYHNITPSRYFARWEPPAARSMEKGRAELLSLAPFTGLALADSAFNEAELAEAGYPRTAVSPLLVDLEEYHAPPDRRTAARLQRDHDAGAHRWLFVGRIAPNKCQHDVIAAFALYRRLFDPSSRLTLVGGVTSPRYLRALERMAADLDLGDSVEMPGAMPFPQLLAHFAGSDAFVCLSEHEGFCVPILEAMELGLPVAAYRATAVGDTVGPAGLLMDDKDPLAVACRIHDLLSDPARVQQLVAAGRDRASRFSLPATSKQFLETLSGWLEDERP